MKFLLIQSLLRKNLYNSITNNKEIDAYFSKYNNYTNFNYININNKCFADDIHLKKCGVKIFNDELFKRINFHQIINSN